MYSKNKKTPTQKKGGHEPPKTQPPLHLFHKKTHNRCTFMVRLAKSSETNNERMQEPQALASLKVWMMMMTKFQSSPGFSLSKEKCYQVTFHKQKTEA